MNLKTSRANNTRIFKIKNAKFSAYSLFWTPSYREILKTCISVPLRLTYDDAQHSNVTPCIFFIENWTVSFKKQSINKKLR